MPFSYIHSFGRVKHPGLDKEPTTFYLIFSSRPVISQSTLLDDIFEWISPFLFKFGHVEVFIVYRKVLGSKTYRCFSLLFEKETIVGWKGKKWKAGCLASDCHLLCGERLRSVLHLHVRERLRSPPLLHHHHHQGHHHAPSFQFVLLG